VKFKAWMLMTLLTITPFANGEGPTRVGNGDNGRDLEALTPVTDGPIYESRRIAIERMKKLNVEGMPYMGGLIPELKKSEMFMTDEDTRPLDSDGEWERSSDGQRVYARTFPVPYSPTRFFPRALELSEAQLVTLHVHEALHRALPTAINTDEDKVSLITLALTSPLATFDRVNKVVQGAIGDQRNTKMAARPSRSEASSRISLSTESSTRRRGAKINYDYFKFRGNTFGSPTRMSDGYPPYELEYHRLSFQTELFRPFKLFEFEWVPELQVQQLVANSYATSVLNSFDRRDLYLGPLSMALMLSHQEAGLTYGPSFRSTFRALDGEDYANRAEDRDVMTFGFFLNNINERRISESHVSYSLPSRSTWEGIKFGGIYSLDWKVQYQLGSVRLGGKIDLDYMNRDGDYDPFTLVQIGPSLSWQIGRYALNVEYTEVVNETESRDLIDLGDVAGHGAGRSQLSIGLSASL
jgi:hypothetical protein